MIAILKYARSFAAAGLAAAAMLTFAGAASAGECPNDKVKDGSVTTGEMTPMGVTDSVIASIDLAPKGGSFTGNIMRLRKLVIQPGGVVPWHDHATRPANIYVVSGTIEEYRSNCAAPIVHMTGEVTAEFGAGLAHWWKNTGSEPVVLLSADIVPAEMTEDHMM